MEKNGWGGKRPNQTGRPKKAEGVRKQHQLRAYDEEWAVIQAFARLVKHGEMKECSDFVKRMEVQKIKIIDEVMTTAEAAERWGISAITVKQACSGQKGLPPRFKECEEFRKSGRTWLITKAGMERLYGPEKEGKE